MAPWRAQDARPNVFAPWPNLFLRSRATPRYETGMRDIAVLLVCATTCGILISASSAAPEHHARKTKFDKTPQDLEAAITSELASYQPMGSPISATLDTFKPVKVRLERGRCYGVVARLGTAADFGAHARAGSVEISFEIAGESYTGGPGLVGPGLVSGGLCPQASGAATLDLQATLGRAQDKSAIHDLGHGPIVHQLYSRAIDDHNLARRKTEEREQIQSTKAAVDARHRQEAAAKEHVCTQCKASYDDCIADWRRGATKKECVREYAGCANKGMSSAPDVTWRYCGAKDPS